MVGPTNLVLMVDGQPSNVTGLSVSADVFAALGVRPRAARTQSKKISAGASRWSGA